MKYTKFLEVLLTNRYFIFSLEDLLFLFPSSKKKTIQNQLTNWVKKGRLIRLKRDLYALSEKTSGGVIIPDLFVANKLYSPSYVSLETALSIYDIIPEVAIQVTSVTSNPTRRFRNKYGSFSYFSVQPRAFTGYSLVEHSGFKVTIAEKEKAIVDFLYFKSRRGEEIDLEEERFDTEILESLDKKKIIRYAELFNKALIRRVKEIFKC